MNLKILTVLVTITLFLTIFSGCLENKETSPTLLPSIIIEYPLDEQIVSDLVMISGGAASTNMKNDIAYVEVSINNNEWQKADGTSKWSYHWSTYELPDGEYIIQVRAWDGISYSKIKTIKVILNNPKKIYSDSAKYAVFIAAANFPQSNESKLGNGGLYFAEEMASYLIETAGYSTENIIILFDDGWIREDNGYGDRIMTLQQRNHFYDITYGGATYDTVQNTLNRIINDANQNDNSEVFLWIFNHGYGNAENLLTGGKIFKQSQIFLWDTLISDKKLGEILDALKSQKTMIIIDACYAGGFADKTIYNIPTSIMLRSGIPKTGRVVIAGASKFRKGYASPAYGPLFSLLWFEGLTSGNADGYRPGIFHRGRPTQLSIFKDGKISAEEAFYYARYVLRTHDELKNFRFMQPQINDRYPHLGFFTKNQGFFFH